MDVTEKFVDLVTHAHEYLSAQQEVLREEFRLATWQRWHWDQDTGLLVFSDGDGVPHLIAEVQFVGSISTVSGTWLWAWANSTVDAALIRGVAQVRAFGEREDIAQLTTDKWEATEVDGWEMTSIAAYLLQARGGYRTPSDTGFTYMVMSFHPLGRATMSAVPYWIQRADFSAVDHAPVMIDDGIRAFETHDWRRELDLQREREEAGHEWCSAGIDLVGGDGRIL